jgi:hypothetical protein
MNSKYVKLAYYRPEDWARLLSIIEDKETFHDTWEEWHKQYQSAKKQLEAQGIKTKDAVVNIDDLISFCFQKGIRNDGKARSTFVAQLDI